MDPELGVRKRQRLSWRGIFSALRAVFIGLLLLYLIVGHVMAWRTAEEVAADPRLAIMPQPLPITTVTDLSDGADVMTPGYSLRVPWKIAKQDNSKTVSILHLSNGASLIVYDFRNDPLGPGLLKNATPEDVSSYKEIYGEPALASRYAFLKAELNTSPSEISFLRRSTRNIATMTRLMGKGGIVLPKSKTVYTIAGGDVRGFQIGDPRQTEQPVMLVLFDQKDDELRIVCHSVAEGQWAQPQINAVIASIHPTTQ